MLQQQDKFEDFIQEFNYERPHQALAMKRPADFYQPSNRKHEGLPDIAYPFHDKTGTLTNCGRSCRQCFLASHPCNKKTCKDEKTPLV